MRRKPDRLPMVVSVFFVGGRLGQETVRPLRAFPILILLAPAYSMGGSR